MTLEDPSAEFGVSRERVCQIEVRAFKKVQSAHEIGLRQARAGRNGAAGVIECRLRIRE